MDGGSIEFEDWEMLEINETPMVSPPDFNGKPIHFHGAGGEGDQVIKTGHFTLVSESPYGKKAVQEKDEPGIDDSSSIHAFSGPKSELCAKEDLNHRGLETRDGKSAVCGVDPDIAGPVEIDFGGVDEKDDLGDGAGSKNDMGRDGIRGVEKFGLERDDPIQILLDSRGNRDTKMGTDGKFELSCTAAGNRLDSEVPQIENENSSESLSDSTGDDFLMGKSVVNVDEIELECRHHSSIADGSESGEGKESVGSNSYSTKFVREEPEFSSEVESGDGPVVDLGVGETKKLVWYKLPLDLLKFCLFRVSPIWSVSIAAAVLGFFILRKRFNNKRKNRSIPLKVSMDDKVSPKMVRVVRLNEAFSMVRRGPVIRSLVAGTGGVIPWPIVSLK